MSVGSMLSTEDTAQEGGAEGDGQQGGVQSAAEGGADCEGLDLAREHMNAIECKCLYSI